MGGECGGVGGRGGRVVGGGEEFAFGVVGGLEGGVCYAIEPGVAGGDADAFGFGDEAGVVGFEQVGLEGFPEFGEAGLMLWQGGEVVHFIGIGVEVVELLCGPRGFPEAALGGVEAAFFPEGKPHSRGWGLELIRHVLAGGEVRQEVAQVHEASVRQAANEIDPFVHASAEPVHVGLGG